MAADQFVADIACAVVDSFAPLVAALQDESAMATLLADLGWGPPDGTVDQSAFAPLADVAEAVSTAAQAVDEFRSGNSEQAVVSLLAATVDLMSALRALAAPGHPGLPDPWGRADFWATLADDLAALLLAVQLRNSQPTVFAVLVLAGVITEERAQADPTTGLTTGRVEDAPYWQLHWDRLEYLISDPKQLAADVYGWGGALDSLRLLRAANSVAQALGVPSAIVDRGESVTDAVGGISGDQLLGCLILRAPILAGSFSGADVDSVAAAGSGEVGLQLAPVPQTASSGAAYGVLLGPYANGTASASFELAPTLDLTIVGAADTTDALGVVIAPEQDARFVGDVASLGAGIAIHLSYAPTDPIVIAGSADATGAFLSSLDIGVDAVESGGEIAVELSAKLSRLTFAMDLSAGDNFLTTVVGGNAARASVDLTITWSNTRGLGLNGATSLTTSVPIDVHLGPMHLTRFEISGGAAPGGSGAGLQLAAGVSAAFVLGPVQGAVDGVGAAMTLAADPHGVLFGVGPALSFKPPDGVGLGVDAPMVSGAGYLACEASTGRYAGALALKIGNISVQGVGVLNTKDVPGGWSLVGLADVSGLNVQLGFGITLTGVGMLVGIHRTVDVQAIQALARAGGLDGLMFPPDLAHNATHAVTQLESVFPSASGQYVFGPTVQLQWGGSGLVTAEVAVYVELPNPLRILLLGSAHLTLPTAKAPVADIRLDLLGVLDLSAKTIAIDMSLGHSTIAGMPLSGQAALRAAWGSNPSFVLAIGGFHPHFVAPAGFPALSRIALQIGGGNVVVRLTAYLAITSNTVQFGAHVDLRAAGGGIELQATVSFDALIQFSPFHLEVDLHISAALSFHGAPIAGLALDVHLDGPGPWHLSGSAHVNVLCLSITVPISGSFGAAIAAPRPETYDPLADLAAAVGEVGNWTLDPPAGTPTLLVRSGVDRSVLHPSSTPEIRQQILPLDLEIDHVGTRRLPKPAAFRVTLPRGPRSDPVTAPFARGQYVELSDAAKLAGPSFDPLPAGIRVDGGISSPTDAMVTGPEVQATVHAFDRRAAAAAPETVKAQPEAAAPTPPQTVALPDYLVEGQLASSAAVVNGATRRRLRGVTAGGILVHQPTYVVMAGTAAPSAARAAAAPASAQAFTSYSEAVAASPGAARVRFLSELQPLDARDGGLG